MVIYSVVYSGDMLNLTNQGPVQLKKEKSYDQMPRSPLVSPITWCNKTYPEPGACGVPCTGFTYRR